MYIRVELLLASAPGRPLLFLFVLRPYRHRDRPLAGLASQYFRPFGKGR